MDPILRHRFFAKVPERPENGCWEWAGHISRNGYGVFRTGPKVNLAHRVAWNISWGILPEPEMKICHACDNRRCVNPDHLFYASQKMNMLDAAMKGRVGSRPGTRPPLAQINAAATHCLRGHPLSGENLRIAGGKRRCYQCHFDRDRKYKAARRANDK